MLRSLSRKFGKIKVAVGNLERLESDILPLTLQTCISVEVNKLFMNPSYFANKIGSIINDNTVDVLLFMASICEMNVATTAYVCTSHKLLILQNAG